MKGKCSKREGKIRNLPSLRRHYPDQVHGFDLSLPLRESTPRNDLGHKCKEELIM
jgi:hypothetical protein